MWTPESHPLKWDKIRLSPIDVLYHYDEPLIFTVSFGPAIFLAYKVGGAGKNRYLMVPTFDAVLAQLRAGRLSVRGALDQQTYWIVDADADLNVDAAWQVADADLPPKFLPKRGLGLFASAGRELPDTLQQSLAFFSVKFTGARLTHEVIQFSRFKSLIDNVYDSVKKIFPPLIINGKPFTREVDYNIFQPKLSSLVISIKEPVVNVQKIMTRTNAVDLHAADFTGHFELSRDEFIARVDEVVSHAEKGELKKGFAAENFDTLDQISEIMPSANNFVDRVEFRSASAKNKVIAIEARVGERIKLAHKKAESDPKIVTGAVIEINEQSATFVIKNKSQRQITCVLSRDLYDQSEFGVGYIARVRGDYIKRKRRDKIIVGDLPEFSSPK